MKITRFTKQAVELDQEIQDLLTSIRTAHAVEFCANQREGMHGGHIGDLAHTRDCLKEIEDRLLKKGEYAE